MNQLSEQIQNELDNRYKQTMLVFAAQFATMIVLTIVAWFIADRAPAENVGTALSSVLWGVLLAIAIGAFLLRRLMFNPRVLRDAATIKGAAGAIKNVQFKTILIMALAETVAVLGFVISLLSGDKYDMLRAAGVSMIVFFISFPRKKSWQLLAQSAL